MILVTSANAPYVGNANELALSFLQFYDTKVLICIFGDDLNVPMLADRRIEYLRLPLSVPHAYRPELYYYKTASIYYAAFSQTDDFIYLDSKFRFLGHPYEIEEKLRTTSRFFVQYPPIERLKNKYWSTQKSIELCKGEAFGESIQYMAGMQAYCVTEENRLFIQEMIALMSDESVAGPGNKTLFPDGDNSSCIAHRNDQSVLTMLINRYGFSQPYDQVLTAKYGDRQTIDCFHPDNQITWNPTITLLPR